MRTLAAQEIVNIWEEGLTRRPIERALILLAAACPDTPSEELAKLSIGQRDAELLSLRERNFGPQLVSLTNCPDCGAPLELSLDVAIIREISYGGLDLDGHTSSEGEGRFSVDAAGYHVEFRLPNSLDLALGAESGGFHETRLLLLERCLLGIYQDGGKGSVESLPEEVVAAVVQEMAEADPQADVQLSLSCASCEHEWQESFDIVSFLWTEIDARARRILHEVHLLASAYGWRETDILAMSSSRRQLYLELLSG